MTNFYEFCFNKTIRSQEEILRLKTSIYLKNNQMLFAKELKQLIKLQRIKQAWIIFISLIYI